MQFSPGDQARICSLMEMRPAEEWRSAGVDLLVCELPAAFGLSAIRRYYTLQQEYRLYAFSLRLEYE